MNKKSYLYLSILVVSFALVLVGLYLFFKSSYFFVVDTWVKQNIILYVVSLFLYKAVGVLFPPIPGGIITLASIPFLGWFNAYLVDLFGSLVGGAVAYFLAKKYGRNILSKILGEDITKKVEKIQIKKDREIEGVFVYRLALGSTILEAVYYGAGLLKVGFKNFLIGSFLSHVVVGVPQFYLANNIFNGENIILTITITLIGVVFVLITKGRYFE